MEMKLSRVWAFGRRTLNKARLCKQAFDKRAVAGQGVGVAHRFGGGEPEDFGDLQGVGGQAVVEEVGGPAEEDEGAVGGFPAPALAEGADGGAEFFSHLADDGIGEVFADLDGAAGEADLARGGDVLAAADEEPAVVGGTVDGGDDAVEVAV